MLAYARSFSAPFVFDDLPAIATNPSIRHLHPLTAALSPPSTAAGAVGRPLVNLSLALNYAAGGLNVRGYHAFNLAVHLLAALVLFGVLRRTLQQPVLRERFGGAATSLAFGIALLWAVHPLQTETVVSVIQRNELLVSLFYLLTLYAWIRADASPAPRGWLALAIAACFLGAASKEVMVSAPLVVLLYDRTFLAGTFREAWRRRWPAYLGLAASWALLVWLVLANGQRAGTVGFGLGTGAWEYLLTQCRALVLYLRLSLWPHPLVLDYGHAVASHVADVLPEALVVVAFLAVTVVALWRWPVIGFLGAWFFAILAPSSSIVPLTTQTIAEHRMYLPLAAIVALAVAGFHRWVGRGSFVVCVVLAVGLGATTLRRTADYRSALAIWTDTIANWPANARARTNLGNALVDDGRTSEALTHYEEAIRLDPHYAEGHYNLGLTLLDLGKPADSIPQFVATLRDNPNSGEAHNNWGNALVRLGRAPEAMPHYEEAVRLRPDDPEAHCNLGSALLRTGALAAAIAQYETALQLRPDFADAHINLANVLAQTGRFAAALPHFAAAAAAAPRDADIRFNWGMALLQAKRPRDAIPQLAEALRLHPDDPQAAQLLAQARRQAGQP